MGAQLATRKAPLRAATPHDERELLVSKWRLQRIEIRRLLLQVLSGELLTYSEAEQAQALRTLCAELVDYVSTGHFRIYGRILPRKLRADAELQSLLQHIFHSIGKSTDAVLGFNDRVQQEAGKPGSSACRVALVRLSRGLLLRFALEEQLLELCGH